ncbi:DUF308 domain-containing protein [Breznakia pachnodae]|uniref:Uncharacterized membrane protein HdeD (DUF308 family) n=1 Tax=Breznakia pachnodae TaxID=265178 RepID=A0ABU0DXZ9_9FIRM|nr:DUF308 domain-containing protein [Breznakia pachnodae]MDQ0359430.1 uncharacterized membrane protein HdeD (DUF308 family) [Breznakia pachnodae]
MKRQTKIDWIELCKGLLFFILGIFTLRNPNKTMTNIVVIFSIILIIYGIVELFLYIKTRKHIVFKTTSLLITSIASLSAGGLLLLNPIIGKWILNIIIPLWMMINSGIHMCRAYILKPITGNVVFILVEVLQLICMTFAVMMLFNSSLFAISFGWLSGMVFIVLGVSDVIESINDVDDESFIELDV